MTRQLYCITVSDSASGSREQRRWVDVGGHSPIGIIFRDATVDTIIVSRTPDGAVLKGNKTTIYRREAP